MPTQHLSRRFIVFLFGVLGLVSVCFLLMFYYFYSAQIADDRAPTMLLNHPQ